MRKAMLLLTLALGLGALTAQMSPLHLVGRVILPVRPLCIPSWD